MNKEDAQASSFRWCVAALKGTLIKSDIASSFRNKFCLCIPELKKACSIKPHAEKHMRF